MPRSRLACFSCSACFCSSSKCCSYRASACALVARSVTVGLLVLAHPRLGSDPQLAVLGGDLGGRSVVAVVVRLFAHPLLRCLTQLGAGGDGQRAQNLKAESTHST